MDGSARGATSPAPAGTVTRPDPRGDDWLGLGDDPLPVADVAAWLVRPDCGAQVVFTGTVRDHADGRVDVTGLDYEAWVEQAAPRLKAVGAEVRRRWPDVGRIALLHRVGQLGLEDVAVVVGVGAPHRGAAFEAARYAIDAVKATVPIWKRERWAGGEDWGTGAVAVVEPEAVDAVGDVGDVGSDRPVS